MFIEGSQKKFRLRQAFVLKMTIRPSQTVWIRRMGKQWANDGLLYPQLEIHGEKCLVETTAKVTITSRQPHISDALSKCSRRNNRRIHALFTWTLVFNSSTDLLLPQSKHKQQKGMFQIRDP